MFFFFAKRRGPYEDPVGIVEYASASDGLAALASLEGYVVAIATAPTVTVLAGSRTVRPLHALVAEHLYDWLAGPDQARPSANPDVFDGCPLVVLRPAVALAAEEADACAAAGFHPNLGMRQVCGVLELALSRREARR